MQRREARLLLKNSIVPTYPCGLLWSLRPPLPYSHPDMHGKVVASFLQAVTKREPPGETRHPLYIEKHPTHATVSEKMPQPLSRT
jgi:hypothetical protein